MKTYTGEYEDIRVSRTSTRDETTVAVVFSGGSARYDSDVIIDVIVDQITRLGYVED